LIRRDIRLVDLMPEPLWGAQQAWLSRYLLLMTLSQDDIFEAALEARPDCADVINTAKGRQWVANMLALV
jgi:hypothetical protein